MKRRSAISTLRAMVPTTKRVAIYCRQSVEDATSEFGSIQAQREAVEAYVRSQREDRWETLPTIYDDCGYSGGTTERPAYKRLMQDVEAGRIDIVAVYKLDRLSRALIDFVGILDTFKTHGVAFCSVTQSFTTGTTTGQLMVNVLMSFAEFERATISDRTRDKMHAARRKGLWTGGPIPLGYDLVGGKLVPNETEAERVRSIFDLFLHEGSIASTLAVLRERGWRTKSWTTREGTATGGRVFTKDSLRATLSNPVYVGRVRLGDETHEGTHAAIVPVEAWEAVQRALSSGERRPQPRPANASNAILRGLLACACCGSPMTTTFASKGPRRTRYYVCGTNAKQGAAACPGSRVSANAIETAVVDRIRYVGSDPAMVEAVVDAARSDLATRLAASAAAIGDHQAHANQIDRERRNLLDAIGRGGSTSGAARLADLDAQHADAERRALAAQIERDRLTRATVDEDELRRLLADFEPVWAALLTPERARVLGLLIDHVTFDAESGEVAITFHAGEAVV